MATFFTKSTLYEVLKFVGHILAILLFIAVGVHYIFSVSRLVFITDCSPSCISSIMFPIATNFRPASEVPEYAILPTSMQQRIVFYGWDYFVIISDVFLRPMYSMFWFFSISFARELGIYAFFIVLSTIVGIWEATKIVLRLVAYFDVTNYWYAYAPNASSAVASFEFKYTLWMTIGTLAYIIVMGIIAGIMSSQAAAALKKEKREGTVPTETIGASISRRLKTSRPPALNFSAGRIVEREKRIVRKTY